MYSFLHELLSDKKGGEIFVLFGFWHFLYIFLTIFVVIAVMLGMRNKHNDIRRKTAKVFVNIAFGMYILDFFLMPLAYGEIDIEKLPFHCCTAMCVMSFLSCYIPRLEKYRTSFALLGFISNFVYLIYPAGVMWKAVHPLSYRVIQTLLFHAVMAMYGFLSIVYTSEKYSVKLALRDLSVIALMILWALAGNYAYNGNTEGYSHFFNWFFVVRDPFNLFPELIAPYIMPFLNMAMFSAVAILVRLLVGKLSSKSLQVSGL